MWQEAGRPDGRAEDFWAEAVRDDKYRELLADIAAALTVIERRSELSRERERTNAWRLNLSFAVLRRANLWAAHLEGAILAGVYLEGAALVEAHLEGAMLGGAYLEGADLRGAHLEGAVLAGARLKGADLTGAHLEGANLLMADLVGANLSGAYLEGTNFGQFQPGRGAAILPEGLFAHLEGADLTGAVGLSEAQLRYAHGDGLTRVPPGLRLAHWPRETDAKVAEAAAWLATPDMAADEHTVFGSLPPAHPDVSAPV